MGSLSALTPCDADASAPEHCQETTDFFWKCGHHVTWRQCKNRLRSDICSLVNGCFIRQLPPQFLTGPCTWCLEVPQDPRRRGIRSHPGCNILPLGELMAQREHMARLHGERDQLIAKRREEERKSAHRLKAETWWQDLQCSMHAKEIDDEVPVLQRTYYFTPDGYSNLFASPEVSVAKLAPELCGICREDFGEPGQSEPVTMPCKHNFHFECIRQWFLTPSHTCPLCRTRFHVARFVWRDDQQQPADPVRHWLNTPSL